MEFSARWASAYTSFYDAYYYELLSAAIISRWQKIDLAVSLVVSLTASGSAFAGLAYWNTNWGKPIWACLATVASLASIAHSVARVPNHLQRQGEARRDFSLLRGSLQVVLHRMLSEGDSPELEREYSPLLTKLVELRAKLDPDIAAGAKLRETVQMELDKTLERLGFNQKGIMGYEGGSNEQASNAKPS